MRCTLRVRALGCPSFSCRTEPLRYNGFIGRQLPHMQHSSRGFIVGGEQWHSQAANVRRRYFVAT